MKRVFVIFTLAVISMGLYGQDDYIFTDVVEISGESQNDLYSKAQEWIFETFNSAQDVIQYSNQDEGVIRGKALFEPNIRYTNKGVVDFSFTIEFKDGKYKYEFKDLYHRDPTPKQYDITGGDFNDEKPDCGGFYMTKGQWEKLREAATKDINAMIASLEKTMRNTNEDDW